MRLRQQLPAYSPLPFTALIQGTLSLVGPTRAGALDEALRVIHGGEVFLTDSGTSALSIAIGAGVSGSRFVRVALPAYGCYDLATAADGAGVKVVLYDLDPVTLSPDWDSFRRALQAGAAIAVVAHLYGIPVDLGLARAAAAETGTLLVEDAAQGSGASFEGRALGGFGSLGVLSFGRGKGVTGGGGGALLANDAEGRAVIARALPSLVISRRGASELLGAVALWLLGRPAIFGLPAALPFLKLGETIYRTPSPPAGISAASAGMLAVTMPQVQAEAEIRRRHAHRLLGQLAGSHRLAQITPPARAEPGYLRLPLLAAAGAYAALCAPAARALGVMPGYPRPLGELPGFGGRVQNPGAGFPGASRLAEGLVTVPVHSKLSERDLAGLEGLLRSAEGT